MSDLQKLGPRGEGLAWNFLRRQGYTIVERNYRTRYGEVDVVARQGETLVFLEVKTRRDLRLGRPEESVDWSKRQKLIRVAQSYLQAHDLEDRPARFDVLSILWDGTGEPEFSLIQDAFMVDEVWS